MMAVLVSAVAIGLVVAISKYSQMAGGKRQAVINENSSRLINEIVISRVGQALASTAILCSEMKKQCYWNEQLPDTKPTDFQFTSVKEKGTSLLLGVETCLPSFTQTVTFDNCKKVSSDVEIRFTGIEGLKQAKLITGEQSSTDQDSYAALVSVSTGFLEASGQTRDFTSSSVIRRPRPYLRVEPTAGACKPTCALSDGNKSQDFCYGRLKIVNNNGKDVTNSKVQYTVYNDGPGHLYHFQIKRSFTPNPTINATKSALPDSVVYDSASDERINGKGSSKKMGLAAGESLQIVDAGLPCYDEKTYQTVVNVFTRQGGNHDGINTGQVLAVYDASVSSSAREFATNSRPSGEAEYSFAMVEPSNALMLGQGGSSVPATQTLTTTVRNVVMVINTGMN